MSKYVQFYNKAVDLLKDGNYDLYPALIYGSEFYNSRDLEILNRVACEVLEIGCRLAATHHPTWLEALQSGASPEQCIRAWKHDDPNGTYLNELKHIGGKC